MHDLVIDNTVVIDGLGGPPARAAFLDFGLDGELDAMFDCKRFNPDENEVRRLLGHPNAAGRPGRVLRAFAA